MNMKSYLPLAAALVLGTMAALVAKTMLSKGHSSSQAAQAAQIVVAKAAVNPGQELTAEQLQLVASNSPTPPAHSFTRVGDVVGRVLTTAVPAGQPVLETELAPRGAASGAAALVPTGMRAITVDVNESGGVGGLLTPGSRVDVLLTAVAADPSRTQAKTIVQNVRVLAVGQRLASAGIYEPSKENATRTVTLLTSAHDAEVIELASSVRPVRLVLRNSADDEDVDTDGVQLTELLGAAGSSGPGLMSRLIMAFQPSAPIVQPAPATQPAVVANPPPATQPAVASDSTLRRHRKTLRFIQGNEEARIVFDVEPQQQAGTDEQEAVPH